MKKYECVKSFSVPKCDDNGFTIDNEDLQVNAGTIWNDEEDKYRFVGGDVRLEDEDGNWIEICRDRLSDCFKGI